MEYEVKIIHKYYGATKTIILFVKEVDTLDELKTAFLKRFGNIHDATNKSMREKPLIKQLTYDAKSVDEWQKLINTNTRWELNVRQIRQ